LSVSLDCPFLISHSVFSNVFLLTLIKNVYLRNGQYRACKIQEEDKKNKKTHTHSTSLKDYWLQSRNVLNKHSELMLKYYWLQSGKCEKKPLTVIKVMTKYISLSPLNDFPIFAPLFW
jgi:hypothetical protein